MPVLAFKIMNLEPGDHLLCLFDSEEEHRSLFTPFILHGFERNEKIIYIYDEYTPETILSYLSDRKVYAKPYLDRKQLVFLPADKIYLDNGMFQPDEITNKFKKFTKKALAEGYAAVRVTGEATWALKAGINLQRIIDYESNINNFFPGSKCTAVCQYDKRRFDSKFILDLLRVHPVAVLK